LEYTILFFVLDVLCSEDLIYAKYFLTGASFETCIILTFVPCEPFLAKCYSKSWLKVLEFVGFSQYLPNIQKFDVYRNKGQVKDSGHITYNEQKNDLYAELNSNTLISQAYSGLRKQFDSPTLQTCDKHV
jgi:hypothetical protein